MYYLRDLYPNMVGATTREKTLMEKEDAQALHTAKIQVNGASIWMILVVLLAVVVAMGWMSK